MAIFKSTFGEISGKVGGNIFSRNKGGAYIKKFSKPTNPATAKQSALRNKLSLASKAWANLDREVKDAYNNWAADHPVLNRLGESIHLSGFGWFQRVGVNYQIVTGTIDGIELLQEYEFTLSELVFSETDLATGLTASFDATISSDEQMILRAQVFNSAGVSNPGRLKQIGVLDGGTTSPINIKTLVEDVFGTLQAGQKVFLEGIPVVGATGLAGSAIVAEPAILTDTTV